MLGAKTSISWGKLCPAQCLSIFMLCPCRHHSGAGCRTSTAQALWTQDQNQDVAGFFLVLLLVTASDAEWCWVSTAGCFFRPTSATFGHFRRHLPAAQNVPLPGLTAGAAQLWHSKTVVIVGSGDFRSQQACTRLSQVFKLQSVFHLMPHLEVL